MKKKVVPKKAPQAVATMIRMPQAVRERLQDLAEREQRSVSKMAVMCIEEGLSKRETA